MVPPGIPGRSDASFVPAYDPAGARRLLAEAGYADPATFPASPSSPPAPATTRRSWPSSGRTSGSPSASSPLDFGTLFERLGTQDSPDLWALSWIADYPSPNDFLGILLGTGQPNNYGSWSNAAFDAAIASAVGTDDPEAARAGYDAAEAILRDEVPTIPVTLRGIGRARPRGAPRRRPERPRRPAPRWTCLGRPMRGALFAVVVAPLMALLLTAPVSRRFGDVRPAERDLDVRRGDRLQAGVREPVPLARVEILLEHPGSIGPSVTQVEGALAGGSRTPGLPAGSCRRRPHLPELADHRPVAPGACRPHDRADGRPAGHRHVRRHPLRLEDARG